MFARKASSKDGKSVPKDWIESFSRLLNESYKKQCEEHSRYFDVYGQIYQEELVIVVSWLPDQDISIAPITCFLSCGPDQIKNEKKVKETQSDFIDVVGLFFDEIFSSDEWSEFEPNWQELTYKQQNYFFKLSRENINLTLEADKLLGEEFLKELEDDEEETEH
jgi:hypothetical protein